MKVVAEDVWCAEERSDDGGGMGIGGADIGVPFGRGGEEAWLAPSPSVTTTPSAFSSPVGAAATVAIRCAPSTAEEGSRVP